MSSTSATPRPPTGEPVAAPARPYPVVRIDGQVLPPAAIEFEFRRLLRFYGGHLPADKLREQIPALRRRAVDQAIGARLLFAEAGRLDFPVTGEEIDERVRDMERQAGGRAKFAALLKRQRVEPAALREQIRLGRRVDKLVEQWTADTPDPTEDELLAHFHAHRDEYRRGERVRGQHILVKPATSAPDEQRKARARLEAVRKRVADGADFAVEAAAHSDCPSGRKAGGSLGWIERGMLLPAFEQALFGLKVGELSGIVETPLGLHILFKNDEEAPTEADFTAVRERIRDFLRHARRGERLSSRVAELRAQADVRIGDDAPQRP
jgi:parvulin-like peptidyl-prolyl isomerase